MPILFLLIVLFLILYFYFLHFSESHIVSVSERIRFIKSLPAELQAEPLPLYFNYRIPLDSKAQFDRADPYYEIGFWFISPLSEYHDALVQDLNSAIRNEQLAFQYYERIEDAPPIDETRSATFQRKEMLFSEQIERSCAPVVPQFRFVLSYTSPQGRKHYENAIVLNLEQILDFQNQWDDSQARLNYTRWSAQAERSKVTPGLRYDILKRDGFRCVLCGRSAKDGVELEVDHIIPISKGGRSVPENLRTLCKDCNRGKRDKFE